MRVPAHPVMLDNPAGHEHFWERALSRRQAMRRIGATAGGVAAASALLRTPAAWATPRGGPNDPTPIPANPQFLDLHVNFPGPNEDPSTVWNFTGKVGVAEIQGTAHDSNGARWFYDADMRFMQGTYVAQNGVTHSGTFGFI
jgi:hypothetical protein